MTGTANIVKSTFDFCGHTLRVAGTPDRPLFRASDVCEMLGIANPSDACSRLDQDEKGIVSTDTLGGRQEILHVTESGLYGLILGSRKPEAKAFRRWVTEEVLPSIRKTGGYGAPALPTDPLELLRLSLDAIAESRRAQAEQDARLSAVEESVALLESTPGRLEQGTGYVSIVGWCRERGVKQPSLAVRSTMGREASEECRRIGATIGTAPDPRFGSVHTYPVDVLDDLFAAR